MSLVGWAWGQQASNPGTVPTVIRFSGNLADADGKPLSGMVGVTFSLYKEEQGGAPLWVETQNVAGDKSGHYSVTLGSTTTQGLPQAIFASGEARWLGVQPQGQAERPRVLLMSVPYALKAADAETVGGLPASAFALAAPSSRAPTVVTAGSPPVGGSGTVNYIPIWTDSTGDLGNSILYQTGSGNTAKVGLNTTTPVAALDIGSGDLSVSAGNLAISSGNLTMGSGNLNLAQTGGGNVGVIALGGAPFIQACCSASAGNTSVGNSAGGFNLGATHNTAEGYQALANSNAPDNTASGYQALVSNGQGKSNTAVGSGALLQNTSGNLNTAVGNRAGFTNTTAGSNNTLVGAGADVGVDGLTFAAAIGSNAIVNESNALVLGGTGANAVKVGIGTATPAATLDVQGTANFTGLITFAPGQTFGGTGTITAVNTPAGSGLTGGGTSGALNLSLLNTCSTGQVLSWSGNAWVCTGLSGGGTITGVTAGTDLTGGGTSGNVTLNLDTTKVPQLGTANIFAGTQTVGSGDLAINTGNLDLPQTASTASGVITLGGAPFISACCSSTSFNTYVGSGAGNFNTQSSDNTAFGFQALTNNTGNTNTAVGATALTANTTGNSNTAVGTSSLQVNTQGGSNTAVGAGALESNGLGLSNTALGSGAGHSNTSGSNNTFVGQAADAGSQTLTNATAIGSAAIVNESNALVLGAPGINVGIGTATPGYALDVHGTGNFTGAVKFSSGQTFPNTISGVTTPAGSGLMGGGTSGTLNLSLINTCASGQVLSWSGSTWMCTSLSGGGTITGVVAGTDLTGGGLTGTVTLNLDTTQVPQLGTANSFAATQTVNGLVAITGSGNGVQFPDGTLQTTAATGGGGIPSGFMILGSSSTAPPGYTLSGTVTSGNVASSVAPMPTARYWLAAAPVSEKIYAMGGIGTNRSELKVNEVYDLSTKSWATKQPMPTSRAKFAAANANGKIYAIGGMVSVNVLKTVEVYDPSNNTWSGGPTLPTARAYLATAVDSTGLYAVGGSNKSLFLKDMDRFSGNGWVARKPMPSPRASLAAAAVNGKVYAIGGYDGHIVLGTVEVYNEQNNTWAAAAPMLTARRDLAAVVLNGKIYAIGGSDGKSSLNVVEVYDPSTNVWSAVPSPLATRGAFGATAANGFVYLMGGTVGTSILNTVEQYSPPQTLYTFTKN
jgi:N-acetylneuraminic acid mutarotase